MTLSFALSSRLRLLPDFPDLLYRKVDASGVYGPI